MRTSQEWAAQVLHLSPTEALPSHRPLLGALSGFIGILLIAGPFLREAAGKSGSEESGAKGTFIGVRPLFLAFAAGSVLIVLLLPFWSPPKGIGPFPGE